MKVGTDAVLLGAWADCGDSSVILDIGCGCGVIALMCAQRNPACRVDALEINPDAAEQAAENVLHSPFKDQVRVINQSLQNFHPAEKYDLVISNPPYFENALLSPVAGRNKVRHTLELNLDDIFLFCSNHLAEQGKVCLILPFEPVKIISAAEKFGFYPAKKCEVSSHPGKKAVRILISFGREMVTSEDSKLVLFSKERIPTTDYRELTKDFYLHF